MEQSGRKRGWGFGLASRVRSIPVPRQRTARSEPAPRRPIFVVDDIAVENGDELGERLREQGISPDEVVFKYVRPRYAPAADSDIRALVKSENLILQFERLLAMHRIVPSAIPLPVGLVRSADTEFVGYLLERVEGETLGALLEAGALPEARRRLQAVERTVAKLHARSLAHGDLNAANIIAADDGRTVLIDPVANPGPGTMLQDELSLRELRELVDG